MELPFFVLIADHIFAVGLPDGHQVSLSLRERMPTPPDGRYQWLVQPGVRLLRDRYGRVRFTEVGFQFEMDPTKFPATEQGRFDAINAFVLPALNRLLSILRTAGELNYLPRMSYSDVIEASFASWFPSFRITSAGLQISGRFSMTSEKITAPDSGPLPSDKIPLVEKLLAKGGDVPQSEVFRALASDSLWTEDYWLSAIYVGMSLEAELDALLDRRSSSIPAADYQKALDLTIGQKASSAAVRTILGSDLYSSPVKIEFKRLLQLRNTAVHKRTTTYEVDGTQFSMIDRASGNEHLALLTSVSGFLQGF